MYIRTNEQTYENLNSEKVSVLLSASVKRFVVSRTRDFFKLMCVDLFIKNSQYHLFSLKVTKLTTLHQTRTITAKKSFFCLKYQKKIGGEHQNPPQVLQLDLRSGSCILLQCNAVYSV